MIGNFFCFSIRLDSFSRYWDWCITIARIFRIRQTLRESTNNSPPPVVKNHRSFQFSRNCSIVSSIHPDLIRLVSACLECRAYTVDKYKNLLQFRPKEEEDVRVYIFALPASPSAQPSSGEIGFAKQRAFIIYVLREFSTLVTVL